MSELEKDLEYIAAKCDTSLEIERWGAEYRLEAMFKGEWIVIQGKTIKIAAFEMMDQIRNELSD